MLLTVFLLQKRHILYTRTNSMEKYSFFKGCFWQIPNMYLWHGYLRWQNLCGSCLTPCVMLLSFDFCVYTHTEIWWSTNSMNLQFPPSDKVALKYDNWCQTVNLWCAFSWYIPKFSWNKQHEIWFKCLYQSQIYCHWPRAFRLKIWVITVFVWKFYPSFFNRHSPKHVQKWNPWHMSCSYIFTLTLPLYSRYYQNLDPT